MAAAADRGPRVVLLDIEGTTTPVEFVYEVLLPFARERVRSFVRERLHVPEVRADLDALRAERAREAAGGVGLPPWQDEPEEALVDSAAAFVHWLMDRDRKSTGLKSLQGRIWEAGYCSGELHGQVYPDVPVALARWRREGRRAAIFSSGSVLAQRLLFSHTSGGDLTPLLGGYFDTTTGPKKEPESYRAIARALGEAPGAVLFVSDVGAELDAARGAGMRTVLCVRAGSPPVSDHRVVGGLDAL